MPDSYEPQYPNPAARCRGNPRASARGGCQPVTGPLRVSFAIHSGTTGLCSHHFRSLLTDAADTKVSRKQPDGDQL